MAKLKITLDVISFIVVYSYDEYFHAGCPFAEHWHYATKKKKAAQIKNKNMSIC